MYSSGRSRRRFRPTRVLGLLVVVAALVAVVLVVHHRHHPTTPSTSAAAPSSTQTPGAAAPSTLAASAGLTPPAIAAASYELLDVRTGEVLVAKNPEQQIPPASLAKLMTFDLALRALADGRIHLTDPVPLGPGVRTLSRTPGLSNMYLDLPPNATVPLQQLMLGMMVASGNDAALAVGEYVGGTASNFIAEMNAEAAKLGMTHTHFVNTNGINAPGQETTAADMAILARHIWLTYPTTYAQFTDVTTFTWQHITFHNYNQLIGVDQAVTGMKSGYWGGVGYHLVTTAQQGQTELVGVVMGTASLGASAQISQTLLNWGFAHFQDVTVPWSRALPPRGLRVWQAKSPSVGLHVTAQPWIVLPVSGSAAAAVQVRAVLPGYVRAPVEAGQVLGKVEATSGGKVVATAPVLARGADPRGSVVAVLWGGFRLWLRTL